MRAAIERFLADLTAGRGFSPRTEDAYRRDLTGWLAFLEARKGKTPEVEELKPGDVSLYLASLTKNGAGARTVARQLAAIRSFARYLRRHGFRADWASTLRSPKLPKPVPSFLTEAETEKLFRLDFGEGADGLRDRAIFELFYATGIRLAELVSLNRDEALSLDRRQVRVLGKGSRERIVPFGRPAAAALQAYIDATPEGGGAVPPGDPLGPVADRTGLPLFLGRGGARISRRTVQRLIQRHLARVAARAGLSPHLLRHTMATHLLSRMSRDQAAGKRGAANRTGSAAQDIRAVQELLGHVSLSSTQVYTHITVDRLRAAMKAAHPRAEDT